MLGIKKLDTVDAGHYRLAIVGLLIIIALMIVSGIIAFSIVLQGEEQTLVPDIKGLDLPEALIKLQEKELYPRLSLRYTDDPESRGQVLEQDPLPGSIVKAGRRIALVVSRGTIQDKVGNFIGQQVDEVKLSLQAVFGSARQLVTIKEPLIYVYDKAPAGMILEQEPEPGTEISGPVQMTFVVSRGAEKAMVKVPDLLGLTINEAALQIEKAGINFTFTARPAEGREQPGTIVAQRPVPGTLEDPTIPVHITWSVPLVKENTVSGLFMQTLPEYPYPFKLSLIAEPPTGPRVPLITVEHPGKQFTFPYSVPKGTVLVLQVLNRVVARVEAGR
jgi:beta-lactam-binding protein with PASTA domain